LLEVLPKILFSLLEFYGFGNAKKKLSSKILEMFTWNGLPGLYEGGVGLPSLFDLLETSRD